MKIRQALLLSTLVSFSLGAFAQEDAPDMLYFSNNSNPAKNTPPTLVVDIDEYKRNEVERKLADYINSKRHSCGWLPLEADDTIRESSSSHANYIKEARAGGFATLNTSSLGMQLDKGNKHFLGETYADRLESLRYYSSSTTGVESVVIISGNKAVDFEERAEDAMNYALKIPHVLRTIFDKNTRHFAVSFRSYKNKDGGLEDLLVISTGDGAGPITDVYGDSDVFVYPCDGVLQFDPADSEVTVYSQTYPELSESTNKPAPLLYMKSNKSSYLDVIDVDFIDKMNDVLVPTKPLYSGVKPDLESLKGIQDNEYFIIPQLDAIHTVQCEDYDEDCYTASEDQTGLDFDVSIILNNGLTTQSKELSLRLVNGVKDVQVEE